MNSKQRKSKKQQLLKEYGAFCCYCHRNLPESKLTLEHLKPRSRGGSNSLENLRLACFECNNGRGDSLLFPKSLVYLNLSKNARTSKIQQ